MQSIQALRERHAALAKEVRDLVEKNNSAWKPEHNDSYNAKMAELDDVKAQIDRLVQIDAQFKDERQQEAIERAASRLDDKREPSARLYAKWLRGGDNALSAQDWADIRATMSTTTTTEGGYTVQSAVAAMIIDSLKAYGGMRSVATLIPTDQGNAMSFPTSDGTSETGELLAENTTATGADPSFGTAALNVFKYSSKIVAVPFELLQDSQVDVEAFVNRRLAQRLGRITNNHFTVGTGSGQPFGVAARASSGKVGTTGQTTSVIFDDLIDLVHSVDPAYRANPACRFMMADASLKVIRKLKDSQNRPIFLPGYDGLGGPMPDTLLGYGITVNQDVATMAANAKSILFGDFSSYYIRDVMQMQMFRFTDSAYTKLGQVGFLAWMRSGGNLLDTGAVKFYQNSAT